MIYIGSYRSHLSACYFRFGHRLEVAMMDGFDIYTFVSLSDLYAALTP